MLIWMKVVPFTDYFSLRNIVTKLFVTIFCPRTWFTTLLVQAMIHLAYVSYYKSYFSNLAVLNPLGLDLITELTYWITITCHIKTPFTLAFVSVYFISAYWNIQVHLFPLSVFYVSNCERKRYIEHAVQILFLLYILKESYFAANGKCPLLLWCEATGCYYIRWNQSCLCYCGTAEGLRASPLQLEPHIWETKLKPEVKQVVASQLCS